MVDSLFRKRENTETGRPGVNDPSAISARKELLLKGVKRQRVLKKLTCEKEACLPVLAWVRLISGNLVAREREFSIESPEEELIAISVERFESTLHAVDLMKSAAQGQSHPSG